MKWKLLGAAVIALGLLLLSRQRKDGDGDKQSERSSDIVSQKNTAFSSAPAAKPSETLPFKSKLRLTHRKLTREETYDLLRNTTIPVARFEDMSIKQGLVELNRLTSEAGIPPEQLKFIRRTTVDSPDDFLERKLEDIAVRNIPLADLLKYLVGNRMIRYRVDRGIVELCDMHEALDHQETSLSPPPENNSPRVSDPFAPD